MAWPTLTTTEMRTRFDLRFSDRPEFSSFFFFFYQGKNTGKKEELWEGACWEGNTSVTQASTSSGSGCQQPLPRKEKIGEKRPHLCRLRCCVVGTEKAPQGNARGVHSRRCWQRERERQADQAWRMEILQAEGVVVVVVAGLTWRTLADGARGSLESRLQGLARLAAWRDEGRLLCDHLGGETAIEEGGRGAKNPRLPC